MFASHRLLSSRTLPIAFAVIASAIFASYYLSRSILGPLNVDEVYFAHSLWLVLHGKTQYVDFFSNHLPTYFAVIRAVLGESSDIGLQFLWSLRLGALVLGLGYVACLVASVGRRALFLVPFLLLFLSFGRMTEIRSDSFGLILMAGAWTSLLVERRGRWNILFAILLAAMAAAFSARGVLMAFGLVLAIGAGLAVDRDRSQTRIALAGLGIVAASALTLFAMDPDYWRKVFFFAFLDPAATFVPPSLVQRFFAPDRFLLVGLMAGSLLVLSIVFVRDLRNSRTAIALTAVGSQLALIVVDPAPHQYVYGWAMIPVLYGLSKTLDLAPKRGRFWLSLAAFGLAGLLVAICAAYPLLKGRQAPTGSIVRVLLDRPIDAQSLDRLPDPALLDLMVSGRRQHSLSNQIAVREAICRRWSGKVVAVWETHPICMHDADYYWYQFKWPSVFAGQPETASLRFDRAVTAPTTVLVIWAPQDAHDFNQRTMNLLSDYSKGPGFAYRAPNPSAEITLGSGDRTLAASSPNEK